MDHRGPEGGTSGEMNAIYVDMDSSNHWQVLPKSLHVCHMECGLLEITARIFPAPKGLLYLCADFVESSVAGDSEMPILRRIKFSQMKDGSGACKKMFDPVLWVPIVRDRLDEIRLYITDKDGDITPFDKCTLNCTLVGREIC